MQVDDLIIIQVTQCHNFSVLVVLMVPTISLASLEYQNATKNSRKHTIVIRIIKLIQLKN